MKRIFFILGMSLIASQCFATDVTYDDKVTGGTFSASEANNVKNAVNSKANISAITWVTATAYTANTQSVTHGGHVFVCIVNHTSSASGAVGDEPGVGDSWATKWKYHGVDLYAAALGEDDNYVTDAEKARLGDLEVTDNVTFGNVTASGGTLYAGVANTTQGALVLYSNTDPIYTAGWLPAATPTGIVTLRFPPAAAGGSNYLLNFDADGTGGFTDPATFGSPADDTAYDATTWDANTDAATKNAIRDKIETLAGGHDAVTINATANGLSVDGSQVLTLGLASTSTIGALSDTDWDTFNNKVSYTPATPGAIGGTTPAAGTFTTVTAAEILSSAADGSRRSILPSNASIAPLADGSEEIYNEGGAIKAVENDTEYDIILSRDFGTGVGTALAAAANGTGGFVVVGNAAGASAVLTGYTSGAGTVAATDTILQAIQKLNGNEQAAIAKYVSGTEADFYGTLLDPQAIYAVDGTNHAVTLINNVPAAFTITEINISCDADPTTEITLMFQHKAAGVGYGTPTTIEAISTVNGTATFTTGFDDATIPAGTKVFVTLSDPDDALNECSWQIEGDWD